MMTTTTTTVHQVKRVALVAITLPCTVAIQAAKQSVTNRTKMEGTGMENVKSDRTIITDGGGRGGYRCPYSRVAAFEKAVKATV